MPLNGLNIAQQEGEGEANVLHFGYSDQVANRLFAEQQQRKQRAYQNYQLQQAQFRKELGTVRSADIPEVISAYQTRRGLKQQLLFNKKLQDDPIAYAQAELALKQADEDYYSKVNGSVEKKTQLEQRSKEAYDHPDLYTDDVHDKIMGWNNIPTSQLNGQKLDSPDAIRYKGSNTDYAAMVKSAVGEPQEVKIGAETLSPDKQTYQQQYYKIPNEPSKIKANLIGQFAERKKGRDAEAILRQITPEEYDRVAKAYDKIPPEQYKQLYGVDKPNLDPANPENSVEFLASFEAKRQAVDNPPRASKIVPRENKDYAYTQQKEMEALRQKNRLALSAYNNSLKKAFDDYKTAKTAQQRTGIIDNIVKQQIDEAKTSPVSRANGGLAGGRLTLNIPNELKNLVGEYVRETNATSGMTKVFKDTPDLVALSKDGKYIIPLYINDKGTTDDGAPISIENYKLLLGDKFLSQKDWKQEMNVGDEDNTPTGNEDDVPDFLKR